VAVIVTYQSARHIPALLRALAVERQAVDLDVIVVDNASSDGTEEHVAQFPWARFVPAGGNLGYAASVNIADRLAPPDKALLVLNPDLVPQPGSVAHLLDGLRHRDVGVVVPRLEENNGALYPSLRHEPTIGRALVDALLGKRAARFLSRWSTTIWDPTFYETEQSPDWAGGAALLVAAECRSVVGRWDESYFLYSEETDFQHRVRQAGMRLLFTPAAAMRHEGGGSGASDELYALSVVNGVRYYRRYHGLWSTVGFATVIALHQATRIHRSRARLALRAIVSPATRATLPGPIAGPPGG
jgi:GT2 family glycosyltransferase